MKIKTFDDYGNGHFDRQTRHIGLQCDDDQEFIKLLVKFNNNMGKPGSVRDKKDSTYFTDPDRLSIVFKHLFQIPITFEGVRIFNIKTQTLTSFLEIDHWIAQTYPKGGAAIMETGNYHKKLTWVVCQSEKEEIMFRLRWGELFNE